MGLCTTIVIYYQNILYHLKNVPYLTNELCVCLEETGDLPKQTLEEVTTNVEPATKVEPEKNVPNLVTVAAPSKLTYRFLSMCSLSNVSVKYEC